MPVVEKRLLSQCFFELIQACLCMRMAGVVIICPASFSLMVQCRKWLLRAIFVCSRVWYGSCKFWGRGKWFRLFSQFCFCPAKRILPIMDSEYRNCHAGVSENSMRDWFDECGLIKPLRRESSVPGNAVNYWKWQIVISGMNTWQVAYFLHEGGWGTAKTK